MILINTIIMNSKNKKKVNTTEIFSSIEKKSLQIITNNHFINDRIAVIITKTEADSLELNNIIKISDNITSNNLLFFPSWETLPYDNYSPSPNIISERISCIYKLRNMKSGILVTSIPAILSRLYPESYLDAHCLIINKGDHLSIQNLSNQLSQAGFLHVSQIAERGEFAVRGAILDIFPPSSKLPIRIDFFDDEIELIKVFDIKTQISLSNIESVEIIPSREVDLSDNGKVNFRQNMRRWLGTKAESHPIYQKISESKFTGGLEYFLPLFFDETATVFDYLSKEADIFLQNGYKTTIKDTLSTIKKRYNKVNKLSFSTPLPSEEIYLNLSEFENYLGSSRKNTNDSGYIYKLLKLSGDSKDKIILTTDFINKSNGVIIVCQGQGQKELIQQKLPSNLEEITFSNWGFQTNNKSFFCKGHLNSSWQIDIADKKIYIISGTEILADSDQDFISQQDENPIDPRSMIDDLSQIEIGDPVVHNEHGVGRYQGLELVTIDNESSEYITISYADNGKLFIPVTSLEAVTRYTGASPENAPLHNLDGRKWEKAKQKAKDKIYDTAVELLEIYAKREMAKTEPIEINYFDLEKFCKGFPFTPTKDQSHTFTAVYRDLESKKPMDRVICGDVGFGKTEIAMRAAFAVANAGKQVAILAPTTLLADQHYKNFLDRFSGFAINVAGLSRFKTAKEQKEIIEKIKEGKVDIIIGTHRIIQKDINFKNLGLLIIDEEHKFGVKQKETMKKLRADANILTLTATPIPRTLSMSMSGLRDLSIIASPPPKRTPVHTIFINYDEVIIYEGIEREVNRGGQVYFLHNEIATMDSFQLNLQKLYPDSKIRHAHGKMSEKELEKIMLDFYNHRFDILLSTTIIESGIDNPNANTIFINRADKFGLAQLHQLRGRVGRSHHQAYAYLITPDESLITKDAQKRMAALESLKGLGVGFMLASEDLEIRGAGELLGDNQSGQIIEIGFSLFNEMLEQTIDSIRNNKDVDFDNSTSREIDIDIGYPALIPESYIYDTHARLIFYKRISSCKSVSELNKLQIELIDRFGNLDMSIKVLFMVSEIKLLAKKIGIIKLTAGEKKINLTLAKNHKINSKKLITLIQKEPMMYQLKSNDKFSIMIEIAEPEKLTNFIISWLEDIIKS